MRWHTGEKIRTEPMLAQDKSPASSDLHRRGGVCVERPLICTQLGNESQVIHRIAQKKENRELTSLVSFL